MRVVCDIEANGLHNPTKVWVIACRDIDKGITEVFRRVSDDELEKARFLNYASRVSTWIGHNWLEYDYPVLADLLGLCIEDVADHSIDTLIVSRLVDYSRDGGHSLEQYGLEFNYPKGDFTAFKQYSIEMEEYCVRDVEITERVFRKHEDYITRCKSACLNEFRFQLVVNSLHNNGFRFDSRKAAKLLVDVEKELKELDAGILNAFPPRELLIREFTPKATKHNTISRSSVPRSLLENIHQYEIGKTYRHTKLEPFNPASHKQIIRVLNEAGWKPIDKTKGHIEAEREVNRLKRSRDRDSSFDITLNDAILELQSKQIVGWKVNENNLTTLPEAAPTPARLLAKRILYESRRRTLTEWLGLVQPDNRIHGKFYGIGSWPHRMAHQKPNTANIPNTFKVSDGSRVLLGKEMRSLWCAPRNRLLVGVDAEAIQLRVFAHLIDDPILTNAIVNGKKSDKTDPHSLNQQYFGKFCKTRNAAKHSLYAIFFGGGPGMIAHIMACEKEEATQAINSLVKKYPGLERLQREVFPVDAKRGYFIGLDGREVRLPGDTEGNRRHLCMSGYLQCGEKLIMALAAIRFLPLLKEYDALLVNFVHDEFQIEVPNNMEIAVKVAKLAADSIRIAGEELNMKCPLAGSYWNDDLNDYTIATNWAYTH